MTEPGQTDSSFLIDACMVLKDGSHGLSLTLLSGQGQRRAQLRDLVVHGRARP